MAWQVCVRREAPAQNQSMSGDPAEQALHLRVGPVGDAGH